MPAKFLPPESAIRLLDLAKSNVPPPKCITELKAQIELATKAAEAKSIRNGKIDLLAIEVVTRMKLDLDSLYCAWAEGKLEDEKRIIIAHR